MGGKPEPGSANSVFSPRISPCTLQEGVKNEKKSFGHPGRDEGGNPFSFRMGTTTFKIAKKRLARKIKDSIAKSASWGTLCAASPASSDCSRSL